MAKRVKVQGDLFHGRIPAGAIYVGRAARGLKQSPFHNPFTVKQYGLDEALRLYAAHIAPMLAEIRAELGGKDLACWCSLPEPGEPDLCHGAILLQLANAAEAEPGEQS
jgi:hypothetical protein